MDTAAPADHFYEAPAFDNARSYDDAQFDEWLEDQCAEFARTVCAKAAYYGRLKDPAEIRSGCLMTLDLHQAAAAFLVGQD